MQKIIQGVRAFRNRIFPSKRRLYTELSSGQRPTTCLITCSDSRIHPESLTGCDPGEVFVVRNAGNLVPQGNASSEAAAVEFALSLGVRDVIICGHSLCGAMQGLFDPAALQGKPAVKSWLKHAHETRRRVDQLLTGEATLEDRVSEAVRQNVLVQREHLLTHPAVSGAVESGEVQLHAWVYQIETGDVLAYDDALGEFECLTSPMRPVAV